jgi:hypothetical protein
MLQHEDISIEEQTYIRDLIIEIEREASKQEEADHSLLIRKFKLIGRIDLKTLNSITLALINHSQPYFSAILGDLAQQIRKEFGFSSLE